MKFILLLSCDDSNSLLSYNLYKFKNSLLDCVKFRVKSRTKYQINCFKMISKMTQEFLSKNKSEQIINKICSFILLKFKKI